MTTFTYIGIIAGLAFIGVWWLVRVLPLMDEREDIWDALDVHLGIPKRYAKLRLRWWWPWGASLRQYTPKGAMVWGTVKVPDNFLALIDQAIRIQLARINHAKPGWDRFRSVSDYAVLMIDPMTINRVTDPGSPALIVSAGNVSAQTAGSTLGTTWEPILQANGGYRLQGTAVDRPYIVIPHQAVQNWAFQDYFVRSVWFESEHVREFINDFHGEFTAHLGPNDVHPHF